MCKNLSKLKITNHPSLQHMKHNICTDWMMHQNLDFYSPDCSSMNRKQNAWTLTSTHVNALTLTQGFLHFFMPSTGFNNHIRLYAHSGKCCSGNSTAGDETAVTSVKALTGSHFYTLTSCQWGNSGMKQFLLYLWTWTLLQVLSTLLSCGSQRSSISISISCSADNITSLSLLMDKGCFHVSLEKHFFQALKWHWGQFN